MQRALLQYFKPENHDIVEKALIMAKRRDLIGTGKDCLIAPSPQRARSAAEAPKEGSPAHAASRAPRSSSTAVPDTTQLTTARGGNRMAGKQRRQKSMRENPAAKIILVVFAVFMLFSLVIYANDVIFKFDFIPLSRRYNILAERQVERSHCRRRRDSSAFYRCRTGRLRADSFR